jgi:hypothetical protein
MHAMPEPVRFDDQKSGDQRSGDQKPGRAKTALGVAALSLLGTLALAAYVGWTTLHPQQAAIDPARVDALEQQASQLSGRVQQAEAKPVPPPTDLAPVQQRLNALDKRLAALDDLDKRLAALEQKALSPTEGASKGDLNTLAGRVDQVAGRQDAIGTREQSDVAAISARLDTLDAKFQTNAGLAGQIGSLADKQSRAARLQAASAALDAGQPLGSLPGAPPALQRFAQTPPPTEAALRLSFDDAARSAQLASRPAVDDKPFLDRVWARAQQSVTVRQGDRVLVGDPIAGVLEHAKQALDAGDLAGSVTALDGLAGPAAAALAPWKADAQSLLDARTALLSLARG